MILDDFALRPFTGAQGDDFYELVSERAQHGSFILTANRSPKDWYELFGAFYIMGHELRCKPRQCEGARHKRWARDILLCGRSSLSALTPFHVPPWRRFL